MHLFDFKTMCYTNIIFILFNTLATVVDILLNHITKSVAMEHRKFKLYKNEVYFLSKQKYKVMIF